MLGRTTKEIAHQLQLSPRTIEIYRGRLIHKFGARNAADLVRKALTREDQACRLVSVQKNAVHETSHRRHLFSQSANFRCLLPLALKKIKHRAPPGSTSSTCREQETNGLSATSHKKWEFPRKFPEKAWEVIENTVKSYFGNIVV